MVQNLKEYNTHIVMQLPIIAQYNILYRLCLIGEEFVD